MRRQRTPLTTIRPAGRAAVHRAGSFHLLRGRIGLPAMLVLACLAMSACSSGNTTNHTNAGPATGPASAPAELLVGSWTGRWDSDGGVLGGAMDCRITRTSEGVYQAVFRSVVAGMFTREDTITLTVRDRSPGDGRWRFDGAEDLGLLAGGKYKYDGWSDGTNFECRYDSSYDKGVFRLARPATDKGVSP